MAETLSAVILFDITPAAAAALLNALAPRCSFLGVNNCTALFLMSFAFSCLVILTASLHNEVLDHAL